MMGVLTDIGWPFPPDGLRAALAWLPLNAPEGARVNNLIGSDPNWNDRLTYQIVGGPDETEFNLRMGVLFTKKAITDPQRTYAIVVRVSDGHFNVDLPLSLTVAEVKTLYLPVVGK
jgi:hypothetical protein